MSALDPNLGIRQRWQLVEFVAGDRCTNLRQCYSRTDMELQLGVSDQSVKLHDWRRRRLISGVRRRQHLKGVPGGGAGDRGTQVWEEWVCASKVKE